MLNALEQQEEIHFAVKEVFSKYPIGQELPSLDPEHVKVARAELILTLQDVLGVTGWQDMVIDEVRNTRMYFTRIPVKEYVTPSVLRDLGFRWVQDLDTWMWQGEEFLEAVGDDYYTRDYVENSDDFVMTENAGWQDTSNTVYVEDEGLQYTRRYAERNYYCHDGGGWYTYPEDSDNADEYLDDYSTDALEQYGFKEIPGETEREGWNGLYFGIELELEFEDDRDNVASAVRAAHEAEYVLSSDGSLDNGGEFKTPPCSYLRMLQEIPIMCDIARRHDMVPHSTCGLHIHVSRAALSELQIAKVRAFLNYSHNFDFIKDMAERYSTQYAQLYPEMKLLEGITEKMSIWKFNPTSKEVDIKKQKAIKYGFRYSALNIGRDSTIEFRLFASTNKPEILLARLQFVKSLIEYCGPEVSLRGFTHYNGYLHYLRKIGCAKSYPELYKYLVSKGYFTQKQKRIAA